MLRKFKHLYSPVEPVSYREGLVFAGMVKSTSKWANAYNYFCATTVFICVMHCLLKIVLEPEDLSTAQIMELVHWAIMYMVCFGCYIDMIKNSHLLNQLHIMIRSGIFKYPLPLTEEQIQVLEEEKKRIRFLVRMIFSIFTMAFLFMQLKPITSTKEQYVFAYAGWFPFKVDSPQTFAAGIAIQFVFGWNIGVPSNAFVAFYMVSLCHLSAQLKVLNISMKNLFKEARNEKDTFKERIKACVDHHNTILRYSEILQEYLFVPMLILAGAMVMLLCITCFILTDPDSDLVVVIPLFTVFIPEMCMAIMFCNAGQRVTDNSDELNYTLYNIEWYKEPLPYRKDLMIVMSMCKKVIKVTGGGIQTYNLEGLKDILQAAYTYFNMLVALRKS